ncbi:MAG: hypothetical protein ABIO05_01650 [Ferruginibacter sp.]
MHLANLTTAGIKRFFVFTTTLFFYTALFAQDNSPYSRYGLGDVSPGQNIINRSMGGISAGYADLFSLNFANPASLGNIRKAVFDLGGDIDRRTLKSNASPEKYTATNTYISYLQFGVPVASRKMLQKGISWGFSFGLKPQTQINYKIENRSRLNGIDSLHTNYEGSGGLNQVILNTGVKIKNFSFGLTGGYSFGNKDYSTRLNFINDTVLYARSNTATKSTFGGAFINAGLQYDIKTTAGILRLGSYANLSHKLKAKESVINETFTFNGNGELQTIDTVAYRPEVRGEITYPATYGFGFTNITKNWVYGADFETTGWNNYRYYQMKDLVQNSWRVKAGAQFAPYKDAAERRYFYLVQYRAGAYLGRDMVNIGDAKRSEYGITLGAGLPLTTQRYDFALLNLGAEFGTRGNKQSKSIRENLIRLSVGITINATWFQKRKYD